MSYSGSVINQVVKNWDSTIDKVQLMTSQRYFGNENWNAGVLLFNAVLNPKPMWIEFDPENNAEDRKKLFDVGIIPSFDIHPSIGWNYDQFAYFSRTVYQDVDSLSVIMTYCQWQWWVNKVWDKGC